MTEKKETIFFSHGPELSRPGNSISTGFFRKLISITIFLICVLTPVHGKAETKAEEPWHIVADKISYDKNQEEYVARGHVVIFKPGRRLSADFARYNMKKQMAWVRGKVVLTAQGDIVTGDRMEMDLNKETGTIYDGSVFIQANHFYIKGKEIKKTGRNQYAAKNGSVSTCDGREPDWELTGSTIDVTLEGYGYIYNAALWAGKLPVIYSPFIFFPAKRRRQSGFLVPEIQYSDRKGVEYVQPLFWAVGRNSDATFYSDYMKERGEKTGAEYRYVLSPKSKGTLMFDYLQDLKTDDGTGDSTKNWGYGDDSWDRPNKDRYWFRMKSNQEAPFGFTAKIDLDVVSDQDYLTEFKHGYTGFERTDEYFGGNFGRDMEDYDQTIRTNKVNLSKTWSSYSLNGEVLWNDDVTKRRWAETDSTIHKLPFVTFTGSRQSLGDTGLYWNFTSEYDRFYRINGTRGHRADIHPRIYFPLRLKNYLSFEPSVGARETVWYVDDYDTGTNDEKEKQFNRQIYDVEMDLSTEFYRIFNLDGLGVDKIQHRIIPKIVYQYIPEQDQSDHPYFDSNDIIERKNLITYSITNRFTSRKPAAHGKAKYTYTEFCYFNLSQSFDINKERENDPEPFSKVTGDLDFILSPYFNLNATGYWSQYESRMTYWDLAGTISDKRGDSLYIKHRFTENTEKSILTTLDLRLTDRLNLYSKYERNLFDQKDIETKVGMRYTAQCWSVDGSWSELEDETRVMVMVNLFGLGGLESMAKNDY